MTVDKKTLESTLTLLRTETSKTNEKRLGHHTGEWERGR